MGSINGIEINLFSRIFPDQDIFLGGQSRITPQDSLRNPSAGGAFGFLLDHGGFGSSIAADARSSRLVEPGTLLGGTQAGNNYASLLNSQYDNALLAEETLKNGQLNAQRAFDRYLTRVNGIPDNPDDPNDVAVPGLISKLETAIPQLRAAGNTTLADSLQLDLDRFRAESANFGTAYETISGQIDRALASTNLGDEIDVANEIVANVDAAVEQVLREDLYTAKVDLIVQNGSTLSELQAYANDHAATAVARAQAEFNNGEITLVELDDVLSKQDTLATTIANISTPDTTYSVFRDFADPFDPELDADQLNSGISRIESGLSYLRALPADMRSFTPPSIGERTSDAVGRLDEAMEPTTRQFNMLLNRYDRLIASAAADPAEVSRLQADKQLLSDSYSDLISDTLDTVFNLETPGLQSNKPTVDVAVASIDTIREDITRNDAALAQTEFRSVLSQAADRLTPVIAQLEATPGSESRLALARNRQAEFLAQDYSVLNETLTPDTDFSVVEGIAQRAYNGFVYVNDALSEFGATPIS